MTDAGLARAGTGGRSAARPAPSFLIVGTSRSGTTLVQRLAWRLAGVRVPPETHFFVTYALQLAGRRRFPLDEAAIRNELGRFRRMRTSWGLDLDLDAVVEDLGGRCASPWDLFGAIVRDLAGPAEVYGEKTPEHLRCWEAIVRRAPDTQLVCVVREPRAVVASNLEVPFAPRSVPWLAERWRTDQRLVRAARRSLGAARCLVLRYEDVVADPDATLGLMSSFLGRPVEPEDAAAEPGAGPAPVDIRVRWEWWKDRAAGPITTERIDAWRSSLPRGDADLVAAVCRDEMRRFGYPTPIGAAAAALRQVSVSPREQGRRAAFRASVVRYRTRIGRIAL